MPQTEERCENCGSRVTMMVQRGSGFCSQNCSDAFQASLSKRRERFFDEYGAINPESNTDRPDSSPVN